MTRFTLLAMTLVAVLTPLANIRSQDNVYFLSYYANADVQGAPDGTLRLTNDANLNGKQPSGDLWAAIYVFGDQAELEECCACKVPPNGYLALSINNALTSDSVNGVMLHRGIIKVLSSSTSDPVKPVLKPGIRAWITHPEALGKGLYSLVAERLTDSNLGSNDLADLERTCSNIEMLAGGLGWCGCDDSGR
jgi:hypothetical protein